MRQVLRISQDVINRGGADTWEIIQSTARSFVIEVERLTGQTYSVQDVTISEPEAPDSEGARTLILTVGDDS